MGTISTASELKAAIRALELKQAGEKLLLKAELKNTAEKLKPANLIKNTLKDLAVHPDLKGDLLNTSLSLAAGFLAKKAAVGSTHNPLRQLLGTVLQMGVTSLFSKNADSIKKGAMRLINNLFNKQNMHEE